MRLRRLFCSASTNSSRQQNNKLNNIFMLHSNWLLLEVVNTRKGIHQNGTYNSGASFLSVANITNINTILYIPFFCFRFRSFVLSAILHRTPDAPNVLKIQRNWLSSNKTECNCNEKPVFRFERAQFTKANSSRSRYFEKFIWNWKKMAFDRIMCHEVNDMPLLLIVLSPLLF